MPISIFCEFKAPECEWLKSFALTLLFAQPMRPALAMPMSVFCEFKAPDCDLLRPSTLRLVSLAASTAADDRLHKTMTVPVKNFMVISFVDVELLFVDDYFFCGDGHRPSSLAGGELLCVRRRQVDGAKLHATVFRGVRILRNQGL